MQLIKIKKVRYATIFFPADDREGKRIVIQLFSKKKE